MFSSIIIITLVTSRCSYPLVRPLFKECVFPILTQAIKRYHWKLSLNKWQCCWQSNCRYFLFVVTDFTSTPSPSTFPAKCFYARCVRNYACEWRLRNAYCIQACFITPIVGLCLNRFTTCCALTLGHFSGCNRPSLSFLFLPFFFTGHSASRDFLGVFIGCLLYHSKKFY